jgi:hypothetical protein
VSPKDSRQVKSGLLDVVKQALERCLRVAEKQLPPVRRRQETWPNRSPANGG